MKEYGVTNLDQQSEIIIFESFLTTFEAVMAASKIGSTLNQTIIT